MVSAQTQTLSYADRAKKGSARASSSTSTSTSTTTAARATGSNDIVGTGASRSTGPATSPHAATVAVSSSSAHPGSEAHTSVAGTTNGINGTSTIGPASPAASASGAALPSTGTAPTLLSPSASSLPSLPSLPTPTNTSKPSTPPASGVGTGAKQNVWALRREARERSVTAPSAALHPATSTTTKSVANSTSSMAPPASEVHPTSSHSTSTSLAAGATSPPPLSTSTPPTSPPSIPPSSFITTTSTTTSGSTKPSSRASVSGPGSRVSPSAAAALLQPLPVVPSAFGAVAGAAAAGGAGEAGPSAAVAAAVLKSGGELPPPAGGAGTSTSTAGGSAANANTNASAPTSIPTSLPASTSGTSTGGAAGTVQVAETLLGDTAAWPEPSVSLQVLEKREGARAAGSGVGGGAGGAGGSPGERERAGEEGVGVGRRSGKKTEWVAISPAELQAAADAVAQQQQHAHPPHGSRASSSRGASVAPSADRSPHHGAGRHRLPQRPPGNPGVMHNNNNINALNPAFLPPGQDEYPHRQSGRPTPNRSRRSSASGTRTRPGSIAPSPAYRNAHLPPHGFVAPSGPLGPNAGFAPQARGDDMLVPPALIVPAPPPTRRRRKQSRPSIRAPGVRMPLRVDGEERIEGAFRFVFGSAVDDEDGEPVPVLQTQSGEVEVVRQPGRFGIGIEQPHPPQLQPQQQQLDNSFPAYGSGYVTPGYPSRPESAQRFNPPNVGMLGLGVPGPNGGYDPRNLQFGVPSLSAGSSPEVRGALGLGDMDLPPPPVGPVGDMHLRRRSSAERYGEREPPVAPRAQRYQDGGPGYGGPGPNGRARGGRGMGGRGGPYGRGGGGFRGGPGGYRNSYAPPPGPPPGVYPMPFDPSDPEAYLHPPPGPPPPGPPPHIPGMELPPIPGYPMGGPPPPAPWMFPPPPGYMPAPPPFVPPYAAPFPPPMPGQPTGMPYPMPGAAPIPTPVTMLSFHLDPLRYYLLGQVEYYFSLHNLVNDVFLRNKMDNEGWVDIALIASFNRMRTLTNDYNLVRETMELSSLVEVRGNQVRLANGQWQQFVMHRTPRQPGVPGANGEVESVTTATNTAPGSETASASAATTLSVPEEEGESKEAEATP